MSTSSVATLHSQKLKKKSLYFLTYPHKFRYYKLLTGIFSRKLAKPTRLWRASSVFIKPRARVRATHMANFIIEKEWIGVFQWSTHIFFKSVFH